MERMWIHSGCHLPVHSSSTKKLGDLFNETKTGAKYVYHVFVLQTSEMTDAQFNRRMRKTACPVVWKGHGVQLPVTPSDHSKEPRPTGAVTAKPDSRAGFLNGIPDAEPCQPAKSLRLVLSAGKSRRICLSEVTRVVFRSSAKATYSQS